MWDSSHSTLIIIFSSLVSFFHIDQIFLFACKYFYIFKSFASIVVSRTTKRNSQTRRVTTLV